MSIQPAHHGLNLVRTFARHAALACALGLGLSAATAQAGVGMATLRTAELAGPVTVFYPSSDPDQPVQRGTTRFAAAPEGAPSVGNGALIVISHGSGGSATTFADIARRMAAAGFVVALPEHEGDNWHDHRFVGPESWKRRPMEVSRAIDAVLADARWSTRLESGKIGMYGMSAGGHTALTLAGGRWSPARLGAHCQAHLQEDFQTCVGLTTALKGNALDALKIAIARTAIDSRLGDETRYGHTDPRLRAIVAEVPLAADFDPATLAQPVAALGLVRAGQDRWLVPRFHIDAVRAACKSCALIVDLPEAGHGALLSPAVPDAPPLLAWLLTSDAPPTPAQIQAAHQRIVDFFLQHLVPPR